jgi:DNA invertase Pin-like site-specific DNA recombinase
MSANHSRRVLSTHVDRLRRVSTAEQNLAHQIDALSRAGVQREHIYLDTASGAKASRPKLDLVLKMLRAGDTLVITRLDRLSRSMLHLVTLGAELREREIGLKVIEQGIDTATAEGRAMFGMLSVLAEFQRELIVANTHDGLASARARGRKGGRRPTGGAQAAAPILAAVRGIAGSSGRTWRSPGSTRTRSGPAR